MTAVPPVCLNCGRHTMQPVVGGFLCTVCGTRSGVVEDHAAPQPELDPAADLRALVSALRQSAARYFTDQGTRSDYALWADLGYIGRRSGWYPSRPRRMKRRRNAA